MTMEAFVIEIDGGYGFTSDFAVERIYRDVRVCRIYAGASDTQRLATGPTHERRRTVPSPRLRGEGKNSCPASGSQADDGDAVVECENQCGSKSIDKTHRRGR